jgi:predicted RNA-binding Zn-ribbon protein involved in translation (DUF1610 family)
MKHLTLLWQMLKKQVDKTTDEEVWAFFAFNNPDLHNTDELKESVIRVAFAFGLNNACQCSQCKQILPDCELKIQNIVTFICPECGNVVQDDESEEEQNLPPRYILATNTQKFEGRSLTLLNGDDVLL